MPNCEWNRPCDCKECRTTMFGVKCPKCDFETTVSYVRERAEITIDKKGIQYYDFEEKATKGHALDCFKCGHSISDVPYFEEVEERVNQEKIKKMSERTCETCNRKEFASFRKLEFKDWKGQTLCIDCVVEKQKNELIDPSTKTERFKINPKTLQYELDRVQIPCKDCGKKQWVRPDEKWKIRCLKCYKKAQLI